MKRKLLILAALAAAIAAISVLWAGDRLPGSGEAQAHDPGFTGAFFTVDIEAITPINTPVVITYLAYHDDGTAGCDGPVSFVDNDPDFALADISAIRNVACIAAQGPGLADIWAAEVTVVPRPNITGEVTWEYQATHGSWQPVSDISLEILPTGMGIANALAPLALTTTMQTVPGLTMFLDNFIFNCLGPGSEGPYSDECTLDNIIISWKVEVCLGFVEAGSGDEGQTAAFQLLLDGQRQNPADFAGNQNASGVGIIRFENDDFETKCMFWTFVTTEPVVRLDVQARKSGGTGSSYVSGGVNGESRIAASFSRAVIEDLTP